MNPPVRFDASIEPVHAVGVIPDDVGRRRRVPAPIDGAPCRLGQGTAIIVARSVPVFVSTLENAP